MQGFVTVVRVMHETPIVVFSSLCTIEPSIRTAVCMFFVQNIDRIDIVWFKPSDEVYAGNGGSSNPSRSNIGVCELVNHRIVEYSSQMNTSSFVEYNSMGRYVV